MKEEARIHPDDIEAMALAFASVLQQARSVSDSEHFDHHRWVSMRILAERERELFWREMTKHVAKWGLIGTVSAAFYALYLGARILLKLPL